MDTASRAFVRERAGGACEYCLLSQEGALAAFHVEHIVAKQHLGENNLSNLALACHHRNLHKGPNLSGIDPLTRRLVPLFHPRRQRWAKHFQRVGARIEGLTPTGRATVQVLAMNEPERVELRGFES